MPALLVARSDGTLLLRLDLGRRRVVTIGRSPRCDLTLSSGSVSRRHALLFQTPTGWRITDTGSRNGLEGPAGRVVAMDLDERTWCRVGSAHLWLDPSGQGVQIPGHGAAMNPATGEVVGEAELFDEPDREPGPVVTLLDPRDRPLRRVALREHDGLIVGSSPECDLVVNDPRVAPFQAVFYREQTRWCVADADGERPLFIEGKRTRRQRLHGGLVLTLGGSRVVVSGPLPRPAEVDDAVRGVQVDPDFGVESSGRTTQLHEGGIRGSRGVGRERSPSQPSRQSMITPFDPLVGEVSAHDANERTDAPDGGPVSAFLPDEAGRQDGDSGPAAESSKSASESIPPPTRPE